MQEAELAAKEPEAITITLPDGKELDGQSWRTTPLEIAEGISKGLALNTIVSKVNDVVWDLQRPLEESCTLEFIKFDSEEGKYVFRHSSAHILGCAMERVFGAKLCVGPPVEQGFYYDVYMGDNTVSAEDLPKIERVCAKVAKEKAPFQRLTITKANLAKMFEENQFKQRLIESKVKTETTTVYRCGDLIDLCRGPHVTHTGKIKAMAVTKNASAYWLADADNEVLQRVYGISFPDKKDLKTWKEQQKLAEERNHRRLGEKQKLFFFHELSPGCAFFLPKGAFVYNTLMNFIREQYLKRGFEEVVTPNIFNSKLWETSGHWQHYKDDMFSFEAEDQTWALKPMNCPSHCLMFKHFNRSYKELPLRYADFGVLHRNEASGSLSGLTRVRRFQQDDAHIFVMPSQIEDEILKSLDFLTYVYDMFGFTFKLELSTRPKKALGEKAVWDKAEAQLKNSLDQFAKDKGVPWELNPGDGAFYGPKIDITIKDALGRYFQCATIQLDFQLPLRFELEYVPKEKNEDGSPSRPVIIHRAILGSVERMMAILIENYNGKWPFWLCPRQACVIPTHPEFNDYAQEVTDYYKQHGFMVDVDVDDARNMKKKIATACSEDYTYLMIVGKKEMEDKTVAMRCGLEQGEARPLAEVLEHFRNLAATKSDDVASFPGKPEAAEAPAATDAAATGGDGADA